MSLLTQFYNCDGGGADSGSVTYDGIYLPADNGVVAVKLNSGGVNSILMITWAGSDALRYLSPSNSTSISDWGFNSDFTISGTAETVAISGCAVQLKTATGALRDVKNLYLRNGGLYMDPAAGKVQNVETLSGDGVITGIDISTSPSLTTIPTSIVFSLKGVANVISGTALDADSVNHILESMVSSGCANSPTTGSLDLSGGTAAGTSALTAAGTAALTALTGAGWTITLNP